MIRAFANATLPDGTHREGILHVDVRPLRSADLTLADGAAKSANGALAYPVIVENTGNVVLSTIAMMPMATSKAAMAIPRSDVACSTRTILLDVLTARRWLCSQRLYRPPAGWPSP